MRAEHDASLRQSIILKRQIEKLCVYITKIACCIKATISFCSIMKNSSIHAEVTRQFVMDQSLAEQY